MTGGRPRFYDDVDSDLDETWEDPNAPRPPPERILAPPEPILPSSERVANRIRALTMYGVECIRLMPGMLEDFDDLPEGEQREAIEACTLHFPQDVLRNAHLLDLDADQLDLLRRVLRVKPHGMEEFLRRENPRVICAHTGRGLGIDPKRREAEIEREARFDPLALLEFPAHTDVPAALAESYRQILRGVAHCWNAVLERTHPHESVDLRPLDARQRLALADAQAAIRRQFGRAILTARGPLDSVLRSLEKESSRVHPADVHPIAAQDIDEGVMLEPLRRAAAETGIPASTLAVFEDGVRRMLAQFRAIDAFLIRHRDSPSGAVRALFGFEPNREPEIVQGPHCLLVRLHDDDDFYRAYRCRLEPHVPVDEPLEDFVQLRKKTAGLSLDDLTLPDGSILNVVLEKARRRPFRGKAVSTFRHEEQHAYTTFFRAYDFHVTKAPQFEPGLPAREMWDRFGRGMSALSAEPRAKQELLCYLRDGTSHWDVYIKLCNRKVDATYDYAGQIKDWLDPSFSVLRGERFNAIYRKPHDKRLIDAVCKGSWAIERLQKADWPTERILELLITEPLLGWPSLVDDIIGKEETHEPEEGPPGVAL